VTFGDHSKTVRLLQFNHRNMNRRLMFTLSLLVLSRCLPGLVQGEQPRDGDTALAT
jgi:hypothetical protein